jgi:hypothetical protein
VTDMKALPITAHAGAYKKSSEVLAHPSRPGVLRPALPWRGDPGDICAANDPAELLRWRLRRFAPPEWHADAACAGQHTATFFPAAGRSAAAAVAICDRCPVRSTCLAEALADPGLDYGVRGGLTARARRARKGTLRRGHRTEQEALD